MRPVPLDEEIRLHILLWIGDDEWKRLPADAKVPLATALRSIQLRQALKEQGLDSDEKAPSWKVFLAIYKKRFKEYTTFESLETFDAQARFIVMQLCKRLQEEGSDPEDYLTWFFDDFLKEEFNKKAYGSPPTIVKTAGNKVYAIFLYEKRDSLKARREHMAEMAVREAVLELATTYLEEKKDKEFGTQIQSYLKGRISLTKLKFIFRNILKENEETELLEKLDSISNGEEKK